jgi:lysozyme family protein
MANILHLIDANQRRWAAMRFTTAKIPEFKKVCEALIAHKAQYQEIAKGVQEITGKPIPWALVAVTDQREHDGPLGLCNSYLGNGQPLGRATTIVPENRGPFLHHDTDTPLRGPFFRGALDALIDVQKINEWDDWSAGGTLTFLERLNGEGYADRGIASPYIWAGTSEQQPGKYVSDHNWDPTFWDPQLGCAGMLRYMAGLDSSITFDPVPPALPVPKPSQPIPAPTPVPPLPSHPPPLVIPTPVPTPVPVPVPTPVNNMGALLQIILSNPAAMSLLTSVISNPQLVQTITSVLTGLSSQVSAGATPTTAVTNLILTQFDLDQAAASVAAEFTKMGLAPLTLDQNREIAAVAVRSYIANTKAGK